MMHQLHEDVLEEILSHLQVKDVLRFKSVSKEWNSIISTPRFVQLHLNKSNSSPSHLRVFMPSQKTFEAVDFHRVDVQELPRPEDTFGLTFIGSSDGLICYLDKSTVTICVWNPSLRLSKTVDLNLKLPLGSVMFSWFGRQSSDDEYKVVLGIRSVDKERSSKSFRNEDFRNHIYLIKPFSGDYLIKPFSGDYCNSESTQLEDHSYMYSWYGGTLIFGIVHWLATRVRTRSIGSTYYHGVITYDFRRKTLGEMLTPVGLDCNGSIGVIDGCLSAICKGPGGVSAINFEVWIMKEYGVEESWTKFTRIVPSGGIDDCIISSRTGLKLVGVTDKGDLIICCAPDCQLLIYNVAEKKSNILVSNGYGLARMYVETLVFP